MVVLQQIYRKRKIEVVVDYIEHEAVALSQLAANSPSTACQVPEAAANRRYGLPPSEPRKR